VPDAEDIADFVPPKDIVMPRQGEHGANGIDHRLAFACEVVHLTLA